MFAVTPGPHVLKRRVPLWVKTLRIAFAAVLVKSGGLFCTLESPTLTSKRSKPHPKTASKSSGISIPTDSRWYKSVTCEILKDRLRANNLRVSGVKVDLAKRLQDYTGKEVLESLTLEQLKAILMKKGLASTGKRAALIGRIKELDKQVTGVKVTGVDKDICVKKTNGVKCASTSVQQDSLVDNHGPLDHGTHNFTVPPPPEPDLSGFLDIPEDRWLNGRVMVRMNFGLFVQLKPPSGSTQWGHVPVNWCKDFASVQTGDDITVRLLRVDTGMDRLLCSMLDVKDQTDQ